MEAAMRRRKRLAGNQNVDERPELVERNEHAKNGPPEFRFSDLPAEIRNQILRICLVDHHPITLSTEQVVESPHDSSSNGSSDGRPNEKATATPVHWNPRVTREDDGSASSCYINASLLSVDSTIYAEATAMLYGLNTFAFGGKRCWYDLTAFDWHLSELGHKHVRSLEIHFPQPDMIGAALDFFALLDEGELPTLEFSKSTSNGLKILKNFPQLNRLTYRVVADLMPRDIRLFRRARGGLKRSCRIILDVRPITVYTRDGAEYEREVRIGSAVLNELRTWGCEIRGSFELVESQRHPFGFERDWRKALYYEILYERRGQR